MITDTEVSSARAAVARYLEAKRRLDEFEARHASDRSVFVWQRPGYLELSSERHEALRALETELLVGPIRYGDSLFLMTNEIPAADHYSCDCDCCCGGCPGHDSELLILPWTDVRNFPNTEIEQ